jgi:hypothetical protein
MTLYISLVYGILYLSFFAIPYSFETDRHWSPTISSLPFLGVMTGVSISSPAVFIYSDKYYQPRLLARGHVLPEDRLPPMMIGSVILPAGLVCLSLSIPLSLSLLSHNTLTPHPHLVLVRMDLHHSDALDPPSPTHNANRRGDNADLHVRHRLHRGHLPHGLGVRAGGQHLRPQHQRRRSKPPLFLSHLPNPRINSVPIDALHRTKEPFLPGSRSTNQDGIRGRAPETR